MSSAWTPASSAVARLGGELVERVERQELQPVDRVEPVAGSTLACTSSMTASVRASR